MKKNICFFLGNLSGIGGTERMTCNLANRLVDDFNVLVVGITMSQKPFFKFDDRITIIPLFKEQVKVMKVFPLIIYRLQQIVGEHNIDVLINVDVVLALFSLPLKIINSSLKIVSWEHFNYKTSLGIKGRVLSRYLSKRYADVIVTLTEEDKGYYEEHGTIKGKILAIPNFIIDIPSISSQCEEHIVLAVGRFCYQKAFDDLVDVWNIVQMNAVANGWKLRIIGDGEDKIEVIDKIQKYGLSGSVEVLPSTNDISSLYLHSSIYVMTSRFEGLPMVLIESKFYGIPIVCLNCITGPKDMIEDGQTGFIIDNRDLKEMANKICYLMANDSVRRNMGRNSLFDSARFTPNSIVAHWKSLLISL